MCCNNMNNYGWQMKNNCCKQEEKYICKCYKEEEKKPCCQKREECSEKSSNIGFGYNNW